MGICENCKCEKCRAARDCKGLFTPEQRSRFNIHVLGRPLVEPEPKTKPVPPPELIAAEKTQEEILRDYNRIHEAWGKAESNVQLGAVDEKKRRQAEAERNDLRSLLEQESTRLQAARVRYSKVHKEWEQQRQQEEYQAGTRQREAQMEAEAKIQRNRLTETRKKVLGIF